MNFWRKHLLFSPRTIGSQEEERLKFISKKTDDGRITGMISFYRKALEVTRQAFYDYLSHKNVPWKYQTLAYEMMKIHEEDQYNDCVALDLTIYLIYCDTHKARAALP